MTIADVLVLIFTWARTFKDYRDGYRLKLGMPLSRVLLRDGLYSSSQHDIRSADFMEKGTIYFMFTPLLISRFLLNLRQVGDPGDSGTDWSDMTDLSTPQFRVPTFSILTGNLAMPLDYTTDDSSITLGDDRPRRRSRIPGSVAEPSGCEEMTESRSDGILEEKVVIHQ
ncbi:hypothetical protein PHLCEN_2v11003 [Hermanssonia centrifuga]|uniref:Uncharacterized protein n=1 Tax=Hermanssonia centrifuga TaxID=98765 RepID=A0A2R6NL94_9APHY|nr:hypothetical protein PHLCEN_2v11003 [Hermanssonia centrifuga]